METPGPPSHSDIDPASHLCRPPLPTRHKSRRDLSHNRLLKLVEFEVEVQDLTFSTRKGQTLHTNASNKQLKKTDRSNKQLKMTDKGPNYSNSKQHVPNNTMHEPNVPPNLSELLPPPLSNILGGRHPHPQHPDNTACATHAMLEVSDTIHVIWGGSSTIRETLIF